MLILHLLSTSSFSGAENVVCQIIDIYKNEKDVQMIYCSLNGAIKETLKSKNIDFVGLKKFTYKEIKKIVNKYKPDVIHCHDIKASVIGSLFYKKCKIISHIHGNSENMKKVSLKSVLFLLASRKISHIFWVSDSSLREYKFSKNVYNKSTVLKNVISIKDIMDKSNDGKVDKSDIVFVGRLTEIKNPFRLIEIFDKVLESVPEAKLTIVGDGNLHDEIVNLIKNKKITNNVNLVGFQINPYKYMKSSKVLIMTSLYEGIPMCALEAMTLGLPIVSTPTDGLVEIIKQGKNGFYSDDDDELSSNIVKLLKDKKTYDMMSSNALIESKRLNDLNKYSKELNRYYFK